eukprot:c21166_g3_i3.p1 GENE.c21166_g3_i3~~c21166_g3_i3.p1  ORF type:complete len:561 (+),score=177.27 c21166_g3_i3:3-1685(+)
MLLACSRSLIDHLEEIEFQVVKISIHGIKQKRSLKFTREYIENIKNGNIVTKRFQYTQVVGIKLSDSQTLVISYNNDHDFTYRSTIAVKIAQELSNRRQLHQCAAYHSIMNSKNGPNGIEIEGQFTSNGIIAFLQNGDLTRVSSARKLLFMSGQTEEQKLHDLLYVWVLEKNSIEAKKINLFIKKTISVCDESIRRKSSFGSKIFGNKSEKRISLFSSVLTNIRQFLDAMAYYIVENRITEIRKKIGNQMGIFLIDEIIEEVLQEATLPVLLPKLKSLQRLHFFENNQNFIHLKCLALRSIHQIAFGIEESMLSPSNWSLAVIEMRRIEQALTPHHMLCILLNTARIIHHLFESEHPNVINFRIGADQFVPIFVFVIVQSCLTEPLFISEILWSLTGCSILNSEGGYYITVFKSCLLHILKLDVDKILEEEKTLKLKLKSRLTVRPPTLSLYPTKQKTNRDRCLAVVFPAENDLTNAISNVYSSRFTSSTKLYIKELHEIHSKLEDGKEQKTPIVQTKDLSSLDKFMKARERVNSEIFPENVTVINANTIKRSLSEPSNK